MVISLCAVPPPPQGVIPTAQRAAIVVGVELPVYDITKKHLLRSGVMGDTILTHFMSVYFNYVALFNFVNVIRLHVTVELWII